MSNNIADELRQALEDHIRKTPAQVAKEVSSTYPAITLQDAQRIRDGLTAVLTARTKPEQAQREKEYIALHRELKRKYRKSGR